MPQLTQAVFVNLGDSPPAPGTDVVVLVDDSGSMAPFVEDVRGALQEFVGRLPAGTRVGLASFGTELRVLCRPTDCGEFLSDQTGRFVAESGGTALFDAIGDAIAVFDDSGRNRLLVLLTDCDEVGSKRHGPESLLPLVACQLVRLLVVRFGEKVDEALDRLAVSTGGGSSRGATWKDIGRILNETATAVRPAPPTLRTELQRLIRERTEEPAPWLSALSLDQWDQMEVRGMDPSHVRFPKVMNGQLAPRKALEERLTQVLTEQLRESSRRATDLPDPDVTLFVTGWAGDLAYRLLSPVVSVIYRRVAESLNITRTVHTIYVPLVKDLATLDRATQAHCWAWLSAALNCDGAALPKAVLACGNGNRHSTLNPRGFHAEPAEVVVQQAANLLWSLCDDPALVSYVCTLPVLKAAGAASVVAPSARLLRRRAAESALRQVREFADATRPPDPAVAGEAKKDVDGWALRATALADRIAGALYGGIGAVRLDPTDFWPPPSGADRDEHASTLIALLEDRGASRQLRRLSFLLRNIRGLGRETLSAKKQEAAEKVDGLLFRRSSGGVSVALEYLARLRVELEEEMERLSLALISREPSHAGRPAPGKAGMERATLAPDAALDRVRRLLENRPLPEAIALRHLTLAPLAGAAAFLSSRLVPRAFLDLGSLDLPLTAAALATTVAVALGWYRWTRYQKLLGKAVSEYLVALENQAFARAVQECLECAREVYTSLSSYIGNKTEAPAWEPPAERTENDLSQMQCVGGFGAYLYAAVERKVAEELEGEASCNPFVVEFGRAVPDIAGKPPRQRPIPDGLEGVAADRAVFDAMDPAWHERWRECLRRKRCDSLEEYLAVHSRRVDLPVDLLASMTCAFSESQRATRDVAALWHLCDEPTHSAIAAEVERRSFPPVAVDERLAACPVVVDFMVAYPEAVAALRARTPGTFQPSEARGDHALAESDRFHFVRVAGTVGAVPLLVDWAACRSSWDQLDEAARRDLLGQWGSGGDPGQWLDQATGERIFAPPEVDSPGGPAEESLV